MQKIISCYLFLIGFSVLCPLAIGSSVYYIDQSGLERNDFNELDAVLAKHDSTVHEWIYWDPFAAMAASSGLSPRETATHLYRAKLYENFGNEYAGRDNSENALRFYSRSMRIYDYLEETMPVSLMISSARAIHKQNRATDALNYLHRALQLMKEQDDYTYAGDVYYLKGRIFCEQKEFEEAARFLQEALYANGKLSDRPEWKRSLFVLGFAYHTLGMYSEAVNAFHHGLDLALNAETLDWVALFRINLGSVSIETRHYEQAYTHLNTAKSLALEYNYIYLLRRAYMLIAIVYERQEMHDDAITYLDSYHTLNDSIFSMEKEKQIDELYKAYEVERIEGEIAALNKDQLLQSEQIRLQRIIIWVVALGLISIAGFAFVFLNKVRHQRQTNKDLVAKNLEIVENEKKDMGRIDQLESILDKQRVRLDIVRKKILPRLSALKLEAEVLQKDDIMKSSDNIYSQTIQHAERIESLIGSGKTIQQLDNKNTGRQEPEESHDELYEEKISELGSAILDVLEDSSAFMEEGFTLEKLAALVESNKKDVSAAINEELGQGFSSLINKYRIREARKMLSNTNYQQYTIEAIAHEVGFKSKSSFNLYFKKHTGLTPSLFKKTVVEASYLSRGSVKEPQDR